MALCANSPTCKNKRRRLVFCVTHAIFVFHPSVFHCHRLIPNVQTPLSYSYFQSSKLSDPLMAPKPDTENGSAPLLGLRDWRDKSKLNNMSISELVSELRDPFLTSDFDLVEETLMAREARLQMEIEEKKRKIVFLQEKFDSKRLQRNNAELELKRVKRGMFDEKLVKVEVEENNGGKIVQLCEKCKVEELNKKGVGESEKSAVGELRSENSRLKVESSKRKFCDLNEGKKMIETDIGGGSATLKRSKHVPLSFGAGSGKKDGMGAIGVQNCRF